MWHEIVLEKRREGKGRTFFFRFLFYRRCALATLKERADFQIPLVTVGVVTAVGGTVDWVLSLQ